ncbi:hypothetical protein Q5P01_014248 [Channa striata]|uniref:Uncharacterized protein n=1 Tax=Channa striata TaxID=64152 RepID=A0AA88SK09_CHASR|nr:hypothetical protein Q5P01_014248 [Channa striata]
MGDEVGVSVRVVVMLVRGSAADGIPWDGQCIPGRLEEGPIANIMSNPPVPPRDFSTAARWCGHHAEMASARGLMRMWSARLLPAIPGPQLSSQRQRASLRLGAGMFVGPGSSRRPDGSSFSGQVPHQQRDKGIWLMYGTSGRADECCRMVRCFRSPRPGSWRKWWSFLLSPPLLWCVTDLLRVVSREPGLFRLARDKNHRYFFPQLLLTEVRPESRVGRSPPVGGPVSVATMTDHPLGMQPTGGCAREELVSHGQTPRSPKVRRTQQRSQVPVGQGAVAVGGHPEGEAGGFDLLDGQELVDLDLTPTLSPEVEGRAPLLHTVQVHRERGSPSIGILEDLETLFSQSPGEANTSTPRTESYKPATVTRCSGRRSAMGDAGRRFREGGGYAGSGIGCGTGSRGMDSAFPVGWRRGPIANIMSNPPVPPRDFSTAARSVRPPRGDGFRRGLMRMWSARLLPGNSGPQLSSQRQRASYGSARDVRGTRQQQRRRRILFFWTVSREPGLFRLARDKNHRYFFPQLLLTEVRPESRVGGRHGWRAVSVATMTDHPLGMQPTGVVHGEELVSHGQTPRSPKVRRTQQRSQVPVGQGAVAVGGHPEGEAGVLTC